MSSFLNGIRFVEQCPADGEMATYLLIHGLGGSLEQWAAVSEQLATTSRVISVDIPGFGDSIGRVSAFDLNESIKRLIEFVEIKDLRQSILVSHSISSVVAARLSAAAPARYARLILVSGSLIRASQIAQNPAIAALHPRTGLYVSLQFLAGAIRFPPVMLSALAQSAILRRALLWPFVAHPQSLDPHNVLRLLAGSGSPAVLKILLSAAQIDYRSAFAGVTHPVDLVWGAKDPLISAYDLREIRHLLAVIEELEIPECGHWPWIENIPALTEFLVMGGERAVQTAN